VSYTQNESKNARMSSLLTLIFSRTGMYQ